MILNGIKKIGGTVWVVQALKCRQWSQEGEHCGHQDTWVEHIELCEYAQESCRDDDFEDVDVCETYSSVLRNSSVDVVIFS